MKETIQEIPQLDRNYLRQHPVFLAPMAGYSDLPFRSICRRLGSSLSVTEFVSVQMLLVDNPRSLKMLQFSEMERPLIIQIFGHDPVKIARAIPKLEKLKPDGIELNCGCSVAKVSQKGSGAALMKNPLLLGQILRTMKKNMTLPLSMKMRLGWDDDNRNVKEIAEIAEAEGCWLVTVHGRTKQMRYSEAAQWDLIGEVRHKLKIALVGNGDINSLAKADEFIKKYRVDGVSIGRAAQGNPWVFTKQLPDLQQKIQEILRHFQEHCQFYGEKLGIITFRKHLQRYLQQDIEPNHMLKLMQFEAGDEVQNYLLDMR